MALEGSIREFGLADILQLLYYQKKTGVLYVEGTLDRVKVYFNEGNVVATKSSKRPEDGRLGRILVKKGLLSEDDLNGLLEEQKSSVTRLGSLIIKKGLVTREDLTEIITRQIIDQVVHIFSWKEGTYEFEPQGVPIDKDLGISLDTQHILMEGLRIVDEWSVVDGILTLDTVFQRTDKPLEEDLTEQEKETLLYIDGENDVSTVVELSAGDDLAISKSLVSFLENGLIEPVERGEEIKEAVAQKSTLVPGILIYLIPVLLLLAFAVSTVPLLWREFALFKRLSATSKIEHVRESIEEYRMLKGRYPETLPAGTIKDPWNNRFFYEPTESGFRLFSAGPDKKPDTGDDIF
ncbi:bacterial type II secretion system protein G [bacterium BMS3Bbin06]|nr:bacterial type II secretion system protein G [bacterium BMS3Abin08]GBE35422.1 bacterial type II secretion system protein G [bacterium BMS3Bbin06]HDY70078.1 DUF4388 domain-containing protein [Nitrospirota bacterium]